MVYPVSYHRLSIFTAFYHFSVIFANFILPYLECGSALLPVKYFLHVKRKRKVGTQRRIMIRLGERQHKLKKVKYLTGAKVTSFCTDQSFSPTNTFTQLCSSLTNTFSPVKYLLFWRDYDNTIILHYLAIIRRNSTRDVVALRFWSKILEINSYRGLQSSFPVTV